MTLVTGDTGFVGRQMLAQLPGCVGLSALRPWLDIRDKAALIEVLSALKPQRVVHLAAQSFVPESFRDPETTFSVNFIGTFRLLEALQESGFTGRLLFVGTGDVYGPVTAADLPLKEERALHPANPYAVSKLAAEALCGQWSRSRSTHFEIVMARPFNHIGPGQATAFVVADFARQIARIRQGLAPAVLSVGNIQVTRDFTDVQDVIAAYGLLLEAGAAGGVYNVCSGIERRLDDIIQQLLNCAGIEARIEIDPTRYRPAEQPRVYGDNTKLIATTGWQPRIPLASSLKTIYSYWEQEIGK